MTTNGTMDWAEATEQQLLDAALKLAPDLGWTSQTATLAGRACGLTPGETGLLLPAGPRDLVALLSRRHDAAALASLSRLDDGNLKIREKIAHAVEARLDAAMVDEAAVRRAVGFLALPSNLALGARLTWESADKLWRWAGDTATDENHYSKRAILSGILAAALATQLTSGRDAARAVISARIDNVMAFEKWKATTKLRPSLFVDALAAGLGRMRYRD